MDGADLCNEIVSRVGAGFVYSEAVARLVNLVFMYDIVHLIFAFFVGTEVKTGGFIKVFCYIQLTFTLQKLGTEGRFHPP